jgi:hypothetical protein
VPALPAAATASDAQVEDGFLVLFLLVVVVITVALPAAAALVPAPAGRVRAAPARLPRGVGRALLGHGLALGLSASVVLLILALAKAGLKEHFLGVATISQRMMAEMEILKIPSQLCTKTIEKLYGVYLKKYFVKCFAKYCVYFFLYMLRMP